MASVCIYPDWTYDVGWCGGVPSLLGLLEKKMGLKKYRGKEDWRYDGLEIFGFRMTALEVKTSRDAPGAFVERVMRWIEEFEEVIGTDPTLPVAVRLRSGEDPQAFAGISYASFQSRHISLEVVCLCGRVLKGSDFCVHRKERGEGTKKA